LMEASDSGMTFGTPVFQVTSLRQPPNNSLLRQTFNGYKNFFNERRILYVTI
jgi:hypothetical protein